MALMVVRWVHLVAAATWVGGLVVMGPLVMALRRAGVQREQLQAGARAFAQVTWTAMAIAIVTGIAQVELIGFPWSDPRLHLKMGMVGLACALALGHQLVARRVSGPVRGVQEVAILLASLGVVGAAVAL
jgi:putative copper export protein